MESIYYSETVGDNKVLTIYYLCIPEMGIKVPEMVLHWGKYSGNFWWFEEGDAIEFLNRFNYQLIGYL